MGQQTGIAEWDMDTTSNGQPIETKVGGSRPLPEKPHRGTAGARVSSTDGEGEGGMLA